MPSNFEFCDGGTLGLVCSGKWVSNNMLFIWVSVLNVYWQLGNLICGVWTKLSYSPLRPIATAHNPCSFHLHRLVLRDLEIQKCLSITWFLFSFMSCQNSLSYCVPYSTYKRLAWRLITKPISLVFIFMWSWMNICYV